MNIGQCSEDVGANSLKEAVLNINKDNYDIF
jgi:hypothetical protein